MWPPAVTPCECEAPGFCQRHQCEKIYESVLACRLNWSAFNQWENGAGPCLDRMRSEAARIASGGQQVADLPPCRHWSEQPLERVVCELCGGRSQQVDVFACAIFAKCTSRRYGTRTAVMRTMPSCIRCESYEPAAGTSPETVLTT